MPGRRGRRDRTEEVGSGVSSRTTHSRELYKGLTFRGGILDESFLDWKWSAILPPDGEG